jgi:hypothetical protein
MYALTGKSLNFRQLINYSYPELRLIVSIISNLTEFLIPPVNPIFDRTSMFLTHNDRQGNGQQIFISVMDAIGK